MVVEFWHKLIEKEPPDVKTETVVMLSLQGRWPQRKETHLKYAVELQIPRNTPMVGMLEPVMERVVYEDVPFNLAAVKQRVEEVKLQRRIAELEEQGKANNHNLVLLYSAQRASMPSKTTPMLFAQGALRIIC